MDIHDRTYRVRATTGQITVTLTIGDGRAITLYRDEVVMLARYFKISCSELLGMAP